MYLLESAISATDIVSMIPSPNTALMVVLCLSVSSPIMLSFINNKHQVKMKKIELLYEKKQSVYLEFAEAYYLFSHSNDESQYRALEAATNKCRLLCRNKKFSIAADNLLHFTASKVSEPSCEKFYLACLDLLYEDLSESEKWLK